MDEKIKIQSFIAIASFFSGVFIACVCLFFIEPLGEISNSAISIVSELLILTGSILGIKTYTDMNTKNLEDRLNKRFNENK